MKIVYCVNNISHVGGMPRVLAIKANALVERYHHEVYIAESDHKAFLPESAVFSPKINFIDLDIHYEKILRVEQWNPLGKYQKAKRLHKRRLTTIFREINPDVVISLGTEEKSFLPLIHGRWKKIREFHWTTKIRDVLSKPQSKKDQIIAKLIDFLERHFVLRLYDKVVLLSEQEKCHYWSTNKNICVIPNPQTFQSNCVSKLKNKKLISIGRLHFQKNYESLIRIFSIVHKRFPDWELEIYGDGSDRKMLQNQIDAFGLTETIGLKGNTKHIKEVLLDASCFVLSSRWEGMPLVMIEAMTCGLPIIAYDCPSGPRDLITDGENGYLIPYGDETAFASKVMELIENENLRVRLGAEAKAKSELYAIDRIMSIWQDLFESLYS